MRTCLETCCSIHCVLHQCRYRCTRAQRQKNREKMHGLTLQTNTDTQIAFLYARAGVAFQIFDAENPCTKCMPKEGNMRTKANTYMHTETRVCAHLHKHSLQVHALSACASVCTRFFTCVKKRCFSMCVYVCVFVLLRLSVCMCTLASECLHKLFLIVNLWM